MTIALPAFHRATDYALRPVRGSRPARSATNATRQPNNRTGDHWSMEIAPGALSPTCARSLLADVLQGVGEPLRAYIPMRGIEMGTPGLPLVAGADQVGGSLTTDGWTPHYSIPKGTMFNVMLASAPSLHITTAAIVAAADGTATIPFWPDLRDIPDNNTPLEFVAPFIEGLIDEGGDHESGLNAAIFIEGFVIEEDA